MREYDQPVADIIGEALRTLAITHEPFLAQIPTVGRAGDFPPEDAEAFGRGQLLNGERVSARMTADWQSMKALDLDAWLEMLWDGAGQFAEGMARMAFDAMDRAAQGSGNAVNFSSGDITHERVLEMLEKMEFDVDENDMPIGLTLVTSPAMAEKLQSLPPLTPEQQARWDDLIRRKKEAQRARKRTRRLD